MGPSGWREGGGSLINPLFPLIVIRPPECDQIVSIRGYYNGAVIYLVP